MNVSILCHVGGESFVQPLRLSLEASGFSTTFIGEDLNAAHGSGSLVWCEWGRGTAESFLRLNNRRLPSIVRVHRYECYQPEFAAFPHELVGCYVVPTHHIAARVRKCCGETPVVVCAYGVDLVKFTPRPTPDLAHSRFGVVGALSPRKNVLRALDILEAQDDRETTMHFAGAWTDDDYRDAVEDRVMRRGLSERVVFCNQVADMNEWWKDKTICVHAAWHESGPYAVLEAAACNVPAIIDGWPGDDRPKWANIDPRGWVEKFHDARKPGDGYWIAAEHAKKRTR